MPHSSGGGSHGGGTHGGGSHGGSSGNHISHHYFPGSRRYRKHRPGYPDEYIYASSKPQKPSIFVLILMVLIGNALGAMILPAFTLLAKKKPEPMPEERKEEEKND